MKLIPNLWERNQRTSINIESENKNRQQNNDNLIVANKISPFGKIYQTFTTNFEVLNVLIINNNEQYFYREWQIQIYEGQLLAEVVRMADFMAANLTYNIVYDGAIYNALDYYNLGSELHQMSFYTIEGLILFFNASVYISKSFGGVEITNPSVKLDIKIKPFLTINQ